jgi:hypothetical protein
MTTPPRLVSVAGRGLGQVLRGVDYRSARAPGPRDVCSCGQKFRRAVRGYVVDVLPERNAKEDKEKNGKQSE